MNILGSFNKVLHHRSHRALLARFTGFIHNENKYYRKEIGRFGTSFSMRVGPQQLLLQVPLRYRDDFLLSLLTKMPLHPHKTNVKLWVNY